MKARKNVNKKIFTSKMQAKLLLVFCIVIFVFVLLAVRIFYIYDKEGQKYTRRVLSQQTYVSRVIPFRRGDILDRNNTVLATSEKVYNLVLDPSLTLEEKKDENGTVTYPYKEATVNALVSCFGLDYEKLNEELKEKSDKKYVVLEKHLSYEKVESFNQYVEDMKKKDKNKKSYIQGAWFEEEYLRKYPLEKTACHIVGFTEQGNNEQGNVGRWGLEEYYDDELNGTNGREYGYFDENLELKRNVKAAVDGNKIISSIDSNLQTIVEKEINQYNKDVGSLNLAVMLMDPNNGEILAMASDRQYDLNNPRDLELFYTKKEIKKMTVEKSLEALNKIWRNYCISDAYEPGSTFKPFTIAAGFEEGKLSGNETYVCDGFQNVAGKDIACSKRAGHGTITLEEAMMFSCNDALMQIVVKEGKSIFDKYQRNFGFGSKTGVDLPGEAVGIIFPKERLNPQELATSSFGQSGTETMVQMLSAYCSVINGGYYYKPHVAKQILNSNGAVVKNMNPILMKSTISKDTSEKLIKYMIRTVEDGTAKGAQVPGYTIGGKTGTAEKNPRKEKKRLVSFIGFASDPDPKVAIYVVIDEPNVIPQGDSSQATKMASRILKKVLPFLEIYPTEVSKKPDTDEKKTETDEKNPVVQNAAEQDTTHNSSKPE